MRLLILLAVVVACVAATRFNDASGSVVQSAVTAGPLGTFCSYLELVTVTITFSNSSTAFIASYYPGIGDFNNMTCPKELYEFNPITSIITFPGINSKVDCLGRNIRLHNASLFFYYDAPRQRIFLVEQKNHKPVMHFVYDRCDNLAPAGSYCAAFKGPTDLRFDFYPSQYKFHFSATIGVTPTICLDVPYYYDATLGLVQYFPNTCFADFLAKYSATNLRLNYAAHDDQIVLYTPWQPSYAAIQCSEPYPQGLYCGSDNSGGYFVFNFTSRVSMDFVYTGRGGTLSCYTRPWYYFVATSNINVGQDYCIHDKLVNLGNEWYKISYIPFYDTVTLQGSAGSFVFTSSLCNTDRNDDTASSSSSANENGETAVNHRLL